MSRFFDVTTANLAFRFLGAIEEMLEKDIADNKAIGDHGAKEILKNVSGDNSVRVLTHCNTGSLATAGYGTALGVIRSLHKRSSLGNVCMSLVSKRYGGFDKIVTLRQCDCRTRVLL